MSKNTSELWSVVPGYYPGFVEIFGASFKISVVTHAADIELVESMNRLEDARRIVACVNACAGVDTDLLEAGELDKPTMLVMQENKDLKRRCDELLETLKSTVSAWDSGRDIVGGMIKAKAVIASAKGIYHE